jgi:hypothetical protein
LINLSLAPVNIGDDEFDRYALLISFPSREYFEICNHLCVTHSDSRRWKALTFSVELEP